MLRLPARRCSLWGVETGSPAERPPQCHDKYLDVAPIASENGPICDEMGPVSYQVGLKKNLGRPKEMPCSVPWPASPSRNERQAEDARRGFFHGFPLSRAGGLPAQGAGARPRQTPAPRPPVRKIDLKHPAPRCRRIWNVSGRVGRRVDLVAGLVVQTAPGQPLGTRSASHWLL